MNAIASWLCHSCGNGVHRKNFIEFSLEYKYEADTSVRTYTFLPATAISKTHPHCTQCLIKRLFSFSVQLVRV